MERKTLSNSETTRLLLAAAHIYNRKISKQIEERFNSKNNYKADTPEKFIDIKAIERESEIGQAREKIRKILLIPASLIGLLGIASQPGWVFLSITLLWIVELLTEIARQKYARKNFHTSNYTSRFLENNYSLEQNVVISGGYTPFVGSGYDITGWSFTIDTTKPQDDSEAPKAIEAQDLYKETIDSIEKLNVSNISIMSKLFVNGRDIRQDKDFLPYILCKPVAIASRETFDKYIGKNDPRVRHYIEIQIASWGGQLVLNTYLRYTKIGKIVFVEARFFLLPPLNEKFLNIDNLTRKITWSQFCGIAFMALLKAPFTWIESALWVAININNYSSTFRKPEEVKEIENNERYNYGWDNSLREIWSQNKYNRYFQMLDKDMYFKIIQQCIINSIVESLKLRGISTEDIKSTETKILNEGIVINGGNIQADSFAVGKNAISLIKNLTNTSNSTNTKDQL